MPWTDREWTERHLLLRELPAAVRPLLPAALGEFTYRSRGSLAQLHFEDPLVHYELWFHWRTGRLEIGLHFEREERTNAALFEWFDRHIVAIKAELGETIELERWDKGWARIYETWPCERVDRAFRAHAIERLARVIGVLEPIHASFDRRSALTSETAITARR